MSEKATCCDPETHKGHLCLLVSEGRFDIVKTLVTNPKFMCFNCGRVADAERNLCNPMPLNERGDG